MVGTAIIGCNGYTGQETLDRVLAHPGLEVLALGSDSLAGSGAAALDVRLNGSLPRFTTNEEALASGAELVFLCLDHTEAAAVAPPPRRAGGRAAGHRGDGRLAAPDRPAGARLRLRGPSRSRP